MTNIDSIENEDIFLGLSWNHDSHAAIYKGGKILAAIGEERISRIKNHYGFPYNAIDECLKISGLKPKQIRTVAIANIIAQPAYLSDVWFNSIKQYDISNSSYIYIKYLILKHEILRFGRSKTKYDKNYLDKNLKIALRKKGIKSEIKFFDHHLCHAASAFYSVDFKDSFIAVIDQYGDDKSCSFWSGEEKGINLLNSYDDIMSPGAFYTEITKYLGFKRYRHEGKVTGLAARGDPNKLHDKLKKLLHFDIDSNYFSIIRPKTKINFFEKLFYGLKKIISFKPYQSTYVLYQDYIDSICKNSSKEDVAAAAQSVLEEFVLNIISYKKNKFDSKNIVLAGGVFANVLVNQKILGTGSYKNIFIFPNMGDGGLALGAAQLGYFSSNRKGKKIPPEHFFLGGKPNDKNLDLYLRKENLKFNIYNNIDQLAEETVRILIEKNVVGIVRDSMEFGPRALCHRSIIATPSDESINKTLNDRLNRTEFMPFAPVIREENLSYIFPDLSCSIPAKFMTITAKVNHQLKHLIPAVVHIDDTARPQTISNEIDPFMHKVLEKFEDKTGIPALINTSFNVHEEPIVYSTDDALRAFKSGRVDNLIINNFIIYKK